MKKSFVLGVVIFVLLFFNSCYKEQKRDLVIINGTENTTQLYLTSPCESNVVTNTIQYNNITLTFNSVLESAYETISQPEFYGRNSTTNETVEIIFKNNLPTQNKKYKLVKLNELNYEDEAIIIYNKPSTQSPIKSYSQGGDLFINVTDSTIIATFCDITLVNYYNSSATMITSGKIKYVK